MVKICFVLNVKHLSNIAIVINLVYFSFLQLSIAQEYGTLIKNIWLIFQAIEVIKCFIFVLIILIYMYKIDCFDSDRHVNHLNMLFIFFKFLLKCRIFKCKISLSFLTYVFSVPSLRRFTCIIITTNK